MCCLCICAAASSSSSGKETNLSLTLGPGAGCKKRRSLRSLLVLDTTCRLQQHDQAYVVKQRKLHLSWSNCGLANTFGIAAWCWSSVFYTRTDPAIKRVLSASAAVPWWRCRPERHVAVLLCSRLGRWRHPMRESNGRLEHLRLRWYRLCRAVSILHLQGKKMNRLIGAACNCGRCLLANH